MSIFLFPFTYLQTLKAPDHASSEFGDITKFRPGEFYDFVIKQHLAERSGPHYDIRIGNPEIGLISWATKKEFPETPGAKIALFPQPLHKFEALEFEGEIPEGYGKGTVKTVRKGKVLITDVSDKHIDFTLEEGRYFARYKLIRTNDPNRWLLIVTTPTQQVPAKQHFKLIDENKARQLISKLGAGIAAVQPKIDGALTFIYISPNGTIDLFSPRLSKITAGPILYTEKVLTVKTKTDIPQKYRDAFLVGEIYGVIKQDGKEVVIPVNEISAFLNSSLSRAIDWLKRKGAEFKVMVFDIAQAPKLGVNEPYSIPYSDRKRLLERFLSHLPSNKFHAPIEVTDRQEAEKLLQDIIARKYPLTKEGIIIYPEVGVPYKFKTYQEGKFWIVGFTPGRGKYKDRGVGGILIAETPDGPPIAVVGTGLTDELREEMYQHPEKFLYRQIAVKFQERTPSGSLRAPVFIQFID